MLAPSSVATSSGFIFTMEAARSAGFKNGRACEIWGTDALWRESSDEATPKGGGSYWSPRAGGVVSLNEEAIQMIREWELPKAATARTRHLRIGITNEIVERNLRNSNAEVDKETLQSALRFDAAQSYATRANRLVYLCTLRMLSPQYPVVLDDEMINYALAFIGATEQTDRSGEIVTLLLEELQENNVLRFKGNQVIFLTKADQYTRDMRNRV